MTIPHPSIWATYSSGYMPNKIFQEKKTQECCYGENIKACFNLNTH